MIGCLTLQVAEVLDPEIDELQAFAAVTGEAVYFSIMTFFAKVLNRSPFGWTTVMVTCPVLLVLMSLTVPFLPSCVPPMTLHWAPSFSLLECLAFIFGVLLPGNARHHRLRDSGLRYETRLHPS